MLRALLAILSLLWQRTTRISWERQKKKQDVHTQCTWLSHDKHTQCVWLSHDEHINRGESIPLWHTEPDPNVSLGKEGGDIGVGASWISMSEISIPSSTGGPWGSTSSTLGSTSSTSGRGAVVGWRVVGGVDVSGAVVMKSHPRQRSQLYFWQCSLAADLVRPLSGIKPTCDRTVCYTNVCTDRQYENTKRNTKVNNQFITFYFAQFLFSCYCQLICSSFDSTNLHPKGTF